MTKQSTGKGALLTAGIAFLSVGVTMVNSEQWWVGLIIGGFGGGLIFLREYLKE